MRIRLYCLLAISLVSIVHADSSCHYSCKTCIDQKYNTCIECSDSYSLFLKSSYHKTDSSFTNMINHGECLATAGFTGSYNYYSLSLLAPILFLLYHNAYLSFVYLHSLQIAASCLFTNSFIPNPLFTFLDTTSYLFVGTKYSTFFKGASQQSYLATSAYRMVDYFGQPSFANNFILGMSVQCILLILLVVTRIGIGCFRLGNSWKHAFNSIYMLSYLLNLFTLFDGTLAFIYFVRHQTTASNLGASYVGMAVFIGYNIYSLVSTILVAKYQKFWIFDNYFPKTDSLFHFSVEILQPIKIVAQAIMCYFLNDSPVLYCLSIIIMEALATKLALWTFAYRPLYQMFSLVNCYYLVFSLISLLGFFMAESKNDQGVSQNVSLIVTFILGALYIVNLIMCARLVMSGEKQDPVQLKQQAQLNEANKGGNISKIMVTEQSMVNNNSSFGNMPQAVLGTEADYDPSQIQEPQRHREKDMYLEEELQFNKTSRPNKIALEQKPTTQLVQPGDNNNEAPSGTLQPKTARFRAGKKPLHTPRREPTPHNKDLGLRIQGAQEDLDAIELQLVEEEPK